MRRNELFRGEHEIDAKKKWNPKRTDRAAALDWNKMGVKSRAADLLEAEELARVQTLEGKSLGDYTESFRRRKRAQTRQI